MFEHLDYVYMPSRDVAADVTYFTEVLGGRLVFAIDGMGTRVAMVALTEDPPRILLAGHLDGDVAGPRLPGRRPRDGDGRARVARLDAGSHAGDPAGPGLLVHRSGRSAAGHLPADQAGHRGGELRGTARLLTSPDADRSVRCRTPFRCRLASSLRDRRGANCMVRGPSRGGSSSTTAHEAGGGVHGQRRSVLSFRSRDRQPTASSTVRRSAGRRAPRTPWRWASIPRPPGAKRPSGCKIRKLTGDTEKGLMLSQVAEVALEHYDIRVSVKTGPTRSRRRPRSSRSGAAADSSSRAIPRRCPRGSRPAARSRPTMPCGSTRSAAATTQRRTRPSSTTRPPMADAQGSTRGRPGGRGRTSWRSQRRSSSTSRRRKLGPGRLYAGFVPAPRRTRGRPSPRADDEARPRRSPARTAGPAPAVTLRFKGRRRRPRSRIACGSTHRSPARG